MFSRGKISEVRPTISRGLDSEVPRPGCSMSCHGRPSRPRPDRNGRPVGPGVGAEPVGERITSVWSARPDLPCCRRSETADFTLRTPLRNPGFGMRRNPALEFSTHRTNRGSPEREAQCGRGSVGRASPCQGEGREFESRRPLGEKSLQPIWGGSNLHPVEWPRGEATDCKSVYTGSNPVSTSGGWRSGSALP